MESTTLLALLALLLLATYKNLPWIWHLRTFHTILTRLYISPPPPSTLHPTHLFLPTISTTRSPLSECDYNMHKSNSTYFTDVDISHANLRCLLFGSRLSVRPASPESIIMILGGVQCVFRREIKPYQGYEIWSRVFSWDGKWMYLVSHFVERGVFEPGFVGDGDGKEGEGDNEMMRKKVFATCVSRYVFKQGRRTYPPERMLRECGLLGKRAVSPGTEEIEERRRRDLDKAQLKLGWDAVHEAFEGNVRAALGRYMS
ncbi:hypothetical protein BO78DRAFT_404788 [Aspergillus sclerotiicarbonarius CBS 121057]|uniref:Capsule polysaccharide biosynthesis protein n=1 Tax=Aspergillus sclerotiicarbonarius (strain CBS 121057 / IBT 28362) TaxID=1448318 RepID=A0A319EJD9_ASPSB|nr:hypothetical protein BO78DRAFT_404788 [Aspergillus sclerotiicarbonarius CBS 121057]